MARHRDRTWVAVIVVGIGLLIAAGLSLFAYIVVTATPLHPDPRDVPSVTRSAPPLAWGPAIQQARQIVRAAVAEQNLPGLSVAVGVGGEIVWTEGFGWADLDKQVPVAPETRFRIGTVSTVLTAAAAGVLLEKGRLKLDDEIQAYVPAFPKRPWPVTLRQVMGHVAGLRSDGGDEGPLFAEHCERPLDALPQFAQRPLLFEPGTRFRYSRYGWIVVSAAIEAAAHEPFLRFMREQIFEPAGMHDTKADPGPAPAPGQASAYFPRFAANPRYGPDPMRDLDYSCYAGSSVFVSTPADLVRYAIAIDRGTLIQPATVRLLQMPQRLRSGQETGYGLGWEVATVALAGKDTRMVGHDGDSLGGTVASLMTFPEHGIVVAVASNISYANTSAVGSQVAQVFAVRGTSAARPAKAGSE
ncbi:MAG TPA: serine hydrolase domain-containing protein [Vicinamibacterales bacterium]|nr:serine hydrolase domain-containing protein [Vicinamibacterales bacterium]